MPITSGSLSPERCAARSATNSLYLYAEPITETTTTLATKSPGGRGGLLIPSPRLGCSGLRRGVSNEGRIKSLLLAGRAPKSGSSSLTPLATRGPPSVITHDDLANSSLALRQSIDKVASGSYIWVMRSVGLKTLKNKLSEYVRLAAGGETVLVTDRDRVVAEIGPPSPTRSSMLSDALLLDAFRQGWMTPPISVGRGPPGRKPVMRIDELLLSLQRDRTDR
jgi:antitoxin (DNA-binding transcriptional repressor) of toxin-antitoxin stability system